MRGAPYGQLGHSKSTQSYINEMPASLPTRTKFNGLHYFASFVPVTEPLGIIAIWTLYPQRSYHHHKSITLSHVTGFVSTTPK